MPITLKSWPARLAAACLALAAFSAHALPTLTLSYTQPSGTVGPDDAVPMWATLTVPAGGPDLRIDPNAAAPFGLDWGDLPLTGFDPIDGTQLEFVDYTTTSHFGYFACGGSFTANCIQGPPYDYSFGGDINPLLAADGSLALAAGSSTQILLGTFSPSAGPVAPGTYTFYDAGFGFDVTGHGVNDQGQTVTIQANIFSIGACTSQTADCAFTRTVSAVPEPGEWALMLAGAAVLTARIKRRRY